MPSTPVWKHMTHTTVQHIQKWIFESSSYFGTRWFTIKRDVDRRAEWFKKRIHCPARSWFYEQQADSCSSSEWKIWWNSGWGKRYEGFFFKDCRFPTTCRFILSTCLRLSLHRVWIFLPHKFFLPEIFRDLISNFPCSLQRPSNPGVQSSLRSCKQLWSRRITSRFPPNRSRSGSGHTLEQIEWLSAHKLQGQIVWFL